MFPTFSNSSQADNVKKEGTTGFVSLCPLGCICCIMQQFYKRRCWCREVKESTGTQTDPEDAETLARRVVRHLKGTSTVGTQTESVKENLPPASPALTGNNHSLEPKIAGEILQRVIKKEDGQAGTDKQPSGGLKLIPINPVVTMAETDKNSPTTTIKLGASNTYRPIVPKSTTTTSLPTTQCLQAQLASLYQTALAIHTTPSQDKGPTVPIPQQHAPMAAHTHRYPVRRGKAPDEPDPIWKKYATHGSTEQAELQTAITHIMDKYDLKGARDPNFERALREVHARVPALRDSTTSRMLLRSKLRHRISSRRHYSRIKTEANDIGMAVSALKRRRMEENAVQHQILGETIVRNSLNRSPPSIPVYRRPLLDTPLIPMQEPEPEQSAPLGQKTETPSPHPRPSTAAHRSTAPSDANPRLASVLASPLNPPIAHTTASRDHVIPSRDKISSNTVSSRGNSMTSAGGWDVMGGDRMKHECGDGGETTTEEEALDLSDPRHDVIIKIEPLDDNEFVT